MHVTVYLAGEIHTDWREQSRFGPVWAPAASWLVAFGLDSVIDVGGGYGRTAC